MRGKGGERTGRDRPSGPGLDRIGQKTYKGTTPGRRQAMEEEKKPLAAHVIDNLAFWSFVALAIAAIYAVWGTLEMLDHYVVSTTAFSPLGIGEDRLDI